MPKNNVLLSVRVTLETKDKLDRLCEHLEKQLGFKPTQAQALEYALTRALEIRLAPDEPRQEPGPKQQKQSRARTRKEPEIDYGAITDETDPHKLDLKGRYAQSIVAEAMQDGDSDWTALPFSYLYEIYKKWLPTSGDPNKNEPLNLNQFISRVRSGEDTPILAPAFGEWTIDEAGDDASGRTSGTPPLRDRYDLSDWLMANPEARTRFQGCVRK